MKEKTIEELLSELMTECGLGEVILPVKPVSGGFLHRMYRVETEFGTYAVKHLNPVIMEREGVHENYERAEKIESIIEKKGIPIVPSLTMHGNKMQNLEGNYFYVFNWLEGRITDWYHISNCECYMAGNILGRIHAIEPRKAPHQEPEMSKIDWHGYLIQAKDEMSEIASLLEENEELLIYAEKELNKARTLLPDILCLSDEDMDPKNIMWDDNGNPWVIDLECLDYGNPISHVLQLALQWSGITTCDIDISRMFSYFEGYLEAYDNGYRAYSDVFGLAYTWLEWLEYNIRRALGECMDKAEKEMGISEAKNTVNRIQYIYKKEKDIKAALGDENQFLWKRIGDIYEK